MVPNAPNAIQSVGNYGAAPPDVNAWPEPNTLVPVAINWTQGGSVVEVEGSFDNWQSRQALHRSGNREFAIVKMLPPGVYQYKFIVDGEWKYAPDQPAMYDEMGNVNNVLVGLCKLNPVYPYAPVASKRMVSTRDPIQ
jgi:5'-AMP-activated protein kinase regulatory beta subunit